MFITGTGCQGKDLWRTDGTVVGTVEIRDLYPSTEWDPSDLTVMGGVIYYAAGWGGGICFGSCPTEDRELWRTDATAVGTWRVKDIDPGCNGEGDPAFKAKLQLYFTANDGIHGEELWRSDGTASGTTMVADLVPGSGASGAAPIGVAGSRLLFKAWQPNISRELWSVEIPL